MPTDTAVWFDLDGTLVRFPDYGDVLATACAAVGIDGDDAVDSFRDAYDAAFFDAFDEFAPEPYRRAAAAGLAAVDADADPVPFVAAVREAEYDAAVSPPAVRPTLSDLAARADVSVGVCTNGVGEWQRRKLRAAGVAAAVDAVVVSYDVGAHKPAPEPFARAEDLLPADHRIMIGDSEAADVAGASDRGWRGLHVAGPDEVPDAVEDALE
ncbi:HAD family hydrolase [Halobaculum lipolyticum]|uniref:HAD family hydrolase n=1 Tax=Halobaculum lipolyticum TaxID=3032001 RepID=A0ABD5WBK3_9EURY|nr:HAD family hydrolase [Halobaculum sp. DT31]